MTETPSDLSLQDQTDEALQVERAQVEQQLTASPFFVGSRLVSVLVSNGLALRGACASHTCRLSAAVPHALPIPERPFNFQEPS